MSILYDNVIRAILLRAGQVGDAADAAAFETLFTNATLANVVGGVEVPLTGLKYGILASEKRIAGLCARSKNPVLRRPLYGKSANIAHLGLIPTTDSATKQWVGELGSVIDSSTNEPLTEKPKQTVLREVRMYSASQLKRRPMHFAWSGDGRVLHTRTNVCVEGSIWDYATQLAAYPAGSSPLAQECEVLWIADVLWNAAQEGWFIQESQVYGNIVRSEERRILSGYLPEATLPDTTASPEPVKN